MSDPRKVLAQLLTRHAWYVDSQKRAWCLGCLDQGRKELRRFADIKEFAAHLVEAIDAEFLVVPHNKIAAPDGFIVLAKPYGTLLATVSRVVWEDRDLAESHMADCAVVSGYPTAELVIAEVREMPNA